MGNQAATDGCLPPKSQMASREIRDKVKIDGEAGTGHHSA